MIERLRASGRIVDVEVAVTTVVGVESHPQQALLVPLVVHPVSNVEEGLHGANVPVAFEREHSARLDDHEQPVGPVVRIGQVDHPSNGEARKGRFERHLGERGRDRCGCGDARWPDGGRRGRRGNGRWPDRGGRGGRGNDRWARLDCSGRCVDARRSRREGRSGRRRAVGRLRWVGLTAARRQEDRQHPDDEYGSERHLGSGFQPNTPALPQAIDSPVRALTIPAASGAVKDEIGIG